MFTNEQIATQVAGQIVELSPEEIDQVSGGGKIANEVGEVVGWMAGFALSAWQSLKP